MNETCVFGEKKEISNIPLPTQYGNGKYVVNGLFMRSFYDGCGSNKSLEDSESSSSSEQGSDTSTSVGNEQFREIQSFYGTQQ